jgi:transposase-like protein
MAAAALTAPHFHDEDAARKFLEGVRWPNGPVCPKCGSVGRAYATKKAGVYRCAEKECRKDFSVTVGTVFERSHISLHKWLMAAHLMAASKKGISSKQLERMLGVTYKTAWFLSHRLREAMTNGSFDTPLGGNGKAVEVDETYWGNQSKKAKGRRGWAHKMKIVSLVERDGSVRSFHVANVDAKTLRPILAKHVATDSRFVTDEAPVYGPLGMAFDFHATVNHSQKEYARGWVHTNTVESVFAIVKRGLYGTYHAVSEAHLKRYVAEFDFRYNHREAAGFNDQMRTVAMLKGAAGKRLTYRMPA